LAEIQLENKTTQFEKQVKNNDNIQKYFEEDQPQDKDESNYEIRNKYLLYRQEVIAQSIGGLNIY